MIIKIKLDLSNNTDKEQYEDFKDAKANKQKLRDIQKEFKETLETIFKCLDTINNPVLDNTESQYKLSEIRKKINKF